MKKIAILCVTGIMLIGCASKPVIDTTPTNPTAVINASGTVIAMILPDYTFKQAVYTRADKRRIENHYKYDSWVANKMFGGEYTDIYRIDRNLLWEIHNKRYSECPLSGCVGGWDFQQAGEDEEQLEYNPMEETQCQMRQVKNSFDVEETGQTRIISGYQTKEYHAKWRVEYEDEAGRKDENLLNIVYWNTLPTDDMQKIWAVHEQATRAYQNVIKENKNPLASLISDKLFNALSAFSGDTSKEDKTWNNEVSKKLALAEGYPISIKIEWFLNRNACPQSHVKKNQNEFDWSNPLDSLKDSAEKMAVDAVKGYFAPDPNKPVFHYVYQVDNPSMQQVHDSIFEVPKGYELKTRQ